jgi:hypothetical protein
MTSKAIISTFGIMVKKSSSTKECLGGGLDPEVSAIGTRG